MKSQDKSPKSLSIEPQKSRYRVRIIFCVVMILITLFIIWPGYQLFSSATPLIFGFPLSFAWIIFCTIIGFFAMLQLYFSDKKAEVGN